MQAAQHERRVAARNCAYEIENFNARRREARAIRERGEYLPDDHLPEISRRYKPVNTGPYYHHIHNVRPHDTTSAAIRLTHAQ